MKSGDNSGRKEAKLVYTSDVTNPNYLNNISGQSDIGNDAIAEMKDTIKDMNKSKRRIISMTQSSVGSNRNRSQKDAMIEKIIDILFSDATKTITELFHATHQPAERTAENKRKLQNSMIRLRVATRDVVTYIRPDGWKINTAYDKTKGVMPIKDAWKKNHGDYDRGTRIESQAPRKSIPKKKEETLSKFESGDVVLTLTTVLTNLPDQWSNMNINIKPDGEITISLTR